MKKYITESGITCSVHINDDKTSWFLNGLLHREDGPAMEYAAGTKIWFIDGRIHRVGEPAIETNKGDKRWYINYELHREDGPAIENASGYKAWYLNGKRLPITSNKQFLRFMNLKAFL